MNNQQKRHFRDSRGTVLLESVMSLPLLLVCVACIAQFAQIWITKHIVFYSAFCATRATLTCNSEMAQNEARQAAELILVNLTASKDKPDFTVTLESSNTFEKTATVKYIMPLMVPMAGEIIAAVDNTPKVKGFPAITLTEKCLLPCPYTTSNYPK